MYDPGDLRVFDPILTEFSVGWADQQLFGLTLFPETPTRSPSGRYRVFDRSDWLIHRSRREPGTIANEVGARKWSEDTYATQEHSLQSPIYDEEREALNSPGGVGNPTFGGDLTIDPEEDAVDYIMRSIMLEHEQKVANAIRNTANYAAGHTVTLAGSQKWSDYTYVTPGDVTSIVSDPVTGLRAAVQRIYLDTGRWPNYMTIPFDAVGVIENHPRVVARFQNFSLSQPNAWQILLGLPPEATDNLTVRVVDSKYNAADNIDVVENITSFWGQDIWLGLVDPTPGQKTKTFGKTFAYPYPSGQTRPTDRWREEPRKADLVRSSYRYDLKIVSNVAGYLFKNAVAALV